MGGPGSIHGVHGGYFHPPGHLDSKAASKEANGIHKAPPEQRHTPGPWPESVGGGAKGGFDATALASKLARFFGRVGGAANRAPHGIDRGSLASGQSNTTHRVSEAVDAAGRLVTSAGNVYEAAKPLLQVAKAGRAAPLALVAVAIGMIPQLKASSSEFVQASRDLLNTASDKKSKETVPAYPTKLR